MLSEYIPNLDSLPQVTVNLHLLGGCNMNCHGCFARFGYGEHESASPCRSLGHAEWLDVIDLLGKDPVLREKPLKLTFVGGEPLLFKRLPELLGRAKSIGATTCVVTNGHLLGTRLPELASTLDWVGLSIDSFDSSVLKSLGRHVRGETVDYNRTADLVRKYGCKLKVNTIISRRNANENMRLEIERASPDRWKLLRFLTIIGENEHVTDMAPTDEEFSAFVQRHRSLSPIAEDNRAMLGSYLIIGPDGSILDDSTGTKVAIGNILKDPLGMTNRSGFTPERFIERNGSYAW